MLKFSKNYVCLLLAFIMTLALGMTALASEQPQPRDPDTMYADTGGGNLNGREDAGLEYKIICKYANGTVLMWYTAVGDTEKYDSSGMLWYNVTGTTTTGSRKSSWVRSDMVRIVENSRGILVPVYSDPALPDVG